MTWFNWMVFLFLTALLASEYGLPAPFGRAVRTVIWAVMLAFLLYGLKP